MKREIYKLEELMDFIKKLEDEPYIVVGDFNQGEYRV